MKTNELKILFTNIKLELGDPPIELLRRIDWDYRFSELGNDWGKCSHSTSEIVVKKSLKMDQLTVTLYHEILHILFPSKPHWWIEKASRKLDRNECFFFGRYTARYNKQKTKIGISYLGIAYFLNELYNRNKSKFR